MRYVVNNEQSIINIADAIREKLEIQDPISIPEMPDYIESISGKMTSIEQVLLPSNELVVDTGIRVTISNYTEGE